MMRRQLCAFLCIALLAVSAFAVPANAGTVSVNISSVSAENPSDPAGRYSAQVPIEVGADDKFYYFGTLGGPSDPWSATMDINGDIDPFTNLVYAVQNNAAVTLAFTVSVTLPTGPLGPATVHGGSVAGSATDANAAGGVTLATFGGEPFFAGQIDGVTVLPIYAHPTSFSAAFGSLIVPPLNPGLPGPTLPSGAVAATIGIVQKFTLTAGDTASGTSFFQVEAVPEPATCLLAVAGLVGCLTARRRD